MERYDFRRYLEILDKLNDSDDNFSMRTDEFDEYIRLRSEFDPIHCSPDPEQKEVYVKRYIIPLLKEYCKLMSAVMEIYVREGSAEIVLSAPSFCYIREDEDIRGIMYYADSVIIEGDGENVRLLMFFRYCDLV